MQCNVKLIQLKKMTPIGFIPLQLHNGQGGITQWPTHIIGLITQNITIIRNSQHIYHLYYICQNNTNTPTAIVSNKMWRAYLVWGLPWFIVTPSRLRQLKPEGQERYSYRLHYQEEGELLMRKSYKRCPDKLQLRLHEINPNFGWWFNYAICYVIDIMPVFPYPGYFRSNYITTNNTDRLS